MTSIDAGRPAGKPTLGQDWPKGLQPVHRRWPLVVSVLLHAGSLLLLAWWLTPRSGGTTSTQVTKVGIAAAVPLPDRTRFASDIQENRDPVDEGAAGATASEPAAAMAPPVAPINLDDILGEMLDPSSGTRGSSTKSSMAFGQADFGDGVDLSSLGDEAVVAGPAKFDAGAGRTTTTLFGVSGSGSVFVYVFDRSESMRGAALRRAKGELIQSLSTLTDQQQFQVIFYHHQPRPFTVGGRSPGLQLASPETIEAAKRFVAAISATGSTDHAAALRMAIRLAPDVIFFLTDAKIQTMSDEVIADLTRRAENAGCVIHAIQFGDAVGPDDRFVEKLAARNGGQYQYLNVASFD